MTSFGCQHPRRKQQRNRQNQNLLCKLIDWFDGEYVPSIELVIRPIVRRQSTQRRLPTKNRVQCNVYRGNGYGLADYLKCTPLQRAIVA
jgi:hypothetical protein